MELTAKESFSNLINSFRFSSIVPSTKEEVLFKPIDTRTLRQLLIYENSQEFDLIDSLLDDILKNCIVSPENLDIDSMLLFDRIKLLFDIRMKSKGESIEKTWTCGKCESQSIQRMDFGAMPYIEYVEPKNNFIEICDGIGFELKHLTRADQKLTSAYVKSLPEMSKSRQAAESSLLIVAASISAYVTPEKKYDGLSFEDKVNMLDQLADSITDNLKKWHKDNFFGYEMKFKHICPHCGNQEEHEMNVSESL